MEGDVYDLNEIRAQMQNPEFGKDTQERFGKFQDLIDAGNFKTNKRGRDFLKLRGLDFSRANPKPKPDSTPESSPEPTPESTPEPTPAPAPYHKLCGKFVKLVQLVPLYPSK